MLMTDVRSLLLSRVADRFERFQTRVSHADLKGRDDLLKWGLKACKHYFKDPFSLQHRWLGEKLRRMTLERGTRVGVEGPRGSAKSTISTMLYPLQCAVEAYEPYIILCADTNEQAQKYLEAIAREVELNDYIHARYPDVAGRGEVWNKSTLVLRNGVRIEALGAGKKIRGRRSGEARPSLVIVDDVEGDDAAFSSRRRKRVYDWFTRAVLSLGDPNTNFLVIGTRIHNDCLTARLSTRAGWQHRMFRAILKWPNRMDLWSEWEQLLGDPSLDKGGSARAKEFFDEHAAEMLEGAELLWPERESLYTLMLQRASDGHPAFEAEKQNNPIDPSRSEWGDEPFKGDIWFDEWPADLDVRVSALDPSKGGQDDTSDFQAMVDVGIRLKEGKVEIYIDSDLSRRDVRLMCATFVERLKTFDPDGAVCEANAFQELLIDDLEAETARQGSLVVIEGIANMKRKVVRLRRLGSYIARGCFRFKRRSRGNAELIKQLIEFPNGEHDDGPDALEMAIRHATQILGMSAEDEEPKSPY